MAVAAVRQVSGHALVATLARHVVRDAQRLTFGLIQSCAVQVLSWALSPIMASWQTPDWNHTVSSLAAFQAKFMPLEGMLPNGIVKVRPQTM